MRLQNINIRDPFILLHDGTYYLYGTRARTAWGPADGFDAYRSDDLVEWEGPFEVFHNDGTFWATKCYWAPECICLDGIFYLVSTFGAEGRAKGVQILSSVSPLGPFAPMTPDVITPQGWDCIDGSLFVDEDGTRWLLFSHSLPDDLRGAYCVLPLADDLSHATGEPITLFHADEAPWSRPIPFAKAEFGIDGDVYFSDGPYAYRDGDGSLRMILSSWGTRGYAIGAALSESGRITGPWKQLEEPIYKENGGHGMVFLTKEGERKLVLHYPNDSLKERPVIVDLR